MDQKDGGPAFPLAITDGQWARDGMSLRDHFAGLAMQGICAHPDTWGLEPTGIARRSYEAADAMLAERAKGQPVDPVAEAAPDLLEALKYARRFVKPADVDTDFIDAALAKARGT